jgi:hypothetical protein
MGKQRKRIRKPGIQEEMQRRIPPVLFLVSWLPYSLLAFPH